MKKNDKTREQLLKDLEKSHERIAELEKSETGRKKAEEALQESEEKYRLLANNSMDAIWLTDLKLVFTYVSPSILNIFGYTVEEWVGTRLSQHAGTKEFFYMARKALHSVKNYKKNKNVIFETKMLHKNGNEIPVEISSKMLFNNKGLPIGLQGTTRDITERKRAKEELIQKNEQLELIMQGANLGWWDWDISSGNEIYNKILPELLGYKISEIEPNIKWWEDKIHPDDLKQVSLDLQEHFDGKTEFYINKHRLKTRTGKWKWFFDHGKVVSRNKDGKPIRMIGTLRDIDNQKRAEEALQKSEAQIRQIIDTVPHMIFAKDRDGRFIMANKAVADGCGTTPENMVGKTHPELLGATPEQYESYLTDDREVIESGKLKFIPEEGYTHPDGRNVIMETTKIPFTSAGIPAVLGVSIDITERKKAEEELKKYRQHLEELVKERTKELKNAQEELIRKEQLAILGQFSGSVSHELRNPLAVIDSSIYYLKMKLKESDKTIHKHLERIGSSVKSSTTIIDSLLSLTRMKRPEMRKNNLIALVSNNIKNTKIPDKVKIIQDFPDKEIAVNIEYEQCRIALKNIINNACEAMDNDGTLTVTIRKTKEKRAEISFEDTGQGIAPENIDKIFLPLFSTKARGIGFGLPITKMIIENHRGTLSVKSESGKGADFIISLPLL